jgi:signal transduction histidine kinase
MSLDMRSESVLFQWDFYERALNNYSIVTRIMDCLGEGDGLIGRMPRIFVEESLFDMCKILKEEKGSIEEGFFSIDDSLNDFDFNEVNILNGGAASPSLMNGAFGYQTLYLYPLKKDIRPTGFLMLGKKFSLSLDERFLRELEIVCGIYNKALSVRPGLAIGENLSRGYENALNELSDAVFLVDKNGAIGYANKKAKKEFEGKKGLLIGEKIDRLVMGISEGPQRGEVTYKSGEQFKVFAMESYPVQRDGSWKGFIFKDIMETRVEEEEKFLKDKMESMGMLAGGIAHDFNNLLTGVLGYAALMKSHTLEEKLFRYAEAIEQSAQRAAILTRHLLNFARRQTKAEGPVDLNALITDILFLLCESFRDLAAEKDLHEDLPPIYGDEAGLQNALLTLCLNAKDAMNGQGVLKVRTRRESMGGREFASVEIEDTGECMNEIREKIFEPRFTTEEAGLKLGMGLYLVDKVVREHGGFIDCESEEGTGTRFALYIPLPLGIVGKRAGSEGPGQAV